MGEDFGFGIFSIHCAARQMDISAFVPLQDLGFARPAARLAVQCVFRNEEALGRRRINDRNSERGFSRHLAGWPPFRASNLGPAVVFRAQYSSSAI